MPRCGYSAATSILRGWSSALLESFAVVNILRDTFDSVKLPFRGDHDRREIPIDPVVSNNIDGDLCEGFELGHLVAA